MASHSPILPLDSSCVSNSSPVRSITGTNWDNTCDWIGLPLGLLTWSLWSLWSSLLWSNPPELLPGRIPVRFQQLMSYDIIPFPQTLTCAGICRMNLEWWWCPLANAISDDIDVQLANNDANTEITTIVSFLLSIISINELLLYQR